MCVQQRRQKAVPLTFGEAWGGRLKENDQVKDNLIQYRIKMHKWKTKAPESRVYTKFSKAI